MSDHERVRQLWQEHEQAAFPRELRGEAVAGVELVLLDADVAGCILAWQGSAKLDAQRDHILRQCRSELDRVLPYLTGTPASDYFRRLAEMADLVLAAR